MKKEERAARNRLIVAGFKLDRTLADLAAEFVVTRERIRQIVAESGCSPEDGGRAHRIRQEADLRLKLRDEDCIERWGCNREVYSRIKGRGGVSAFSQQRANARTLGIPWRMTLPQWWDVWEKSGHWEQRGRGRDRYCMARYYDVGSYSPRNVRIVTNHANLKERWIDGKLDRQGCPMRGVRLGARGTKRPWRVCHPGQPSRSFATSAEAIEFKKSLLLMFPYRGHPAGRPVSAKQRAASLRNLVLAKAALDRKRAASSDRSRAS